jgi:hypothetical protein
VGKRLSQAKDFPLENLRRAYPFHELFFRDEALIAFKLQRGIVTTMGRGLYPPIAEFVAHDKYRQVHLDYSLSEELDISQCNKIEEIVTALRTAKRNPNQEQELKEILGTRGGGRRVATIIADLYIGDFPNSPFFAEIKTPLPNLDICAESKKKLLYFWAIMNARGESTDNAFLAFPYNPYVKRESYGWSFTSKVMDMNHQVLIAEEFWDRIGSTGTYEELLQILAEIKQEMPLK